MPESTILRLTGMGIPPYSARGLTQSLEPIEAAGQMRRTINGALLDISDEVMRKYRSTVSGSDQEPPAIGARWPGALLTVDCILELPVEGLLGLTTEGTEEESTDLIFEREHVPGSIRQADGFTYYRPRLSMRVMGYTTSEAEWDAAVTWSLQLEEV